MLYSFFLLLLLSFILLHFFTKTGGHFSLKTSAINLKLRNSDQVNDECTSDSSQVSHSNTRH